MNNKNILKQILQPYELLNNKLIRLGRIGDGGYVIDNKALKESKLCYSYGIADEISFEQDLIKENKEIICHLYDHTVDSPKLNERMVFYKEGLAGRKLPNLNSFIEHFKENKHSFDNGVILKLDAEGAEYDLFRECTMIDFKNLSSIILEIHDIHTRLYDFIKIIQNLNEYFVISHIHGNNCGLEFVYDNFKLPCTLEITYVSKMTNNIGNALNIIYPTKIDYPNEPLRNDYNIDFSV
jgi:hypothetical protein